MLQAVDLGTKWYKREKQHNTDITCARVCVCVRVCTGH